VGERATWRTDRMVLAILISSEINAIQSSVVHWSSSLIFDLDLTCVLLAELCMPALGMTVNQMLLHSSIIVVIDTVVGKSVDATMSM